MKSKIFIFLLLCSTIASAQFLEFGGSLGALNYTGDLNPYPRLSGTQLGYGAVYRMNFSPVLSIKMGAMYGKVSGDDSNPVDALSVARDYRFKHRVIEFNTVFEFHFLDYRSESNPLDWAPFAFMGIGFVNVRDVRPTLETFNPIQFMVPFGLGVKYNVSKRFTLTAEVGARKTFFDYLDGISEGDTYIKDHQYGNPVNDDWYFFTGVSLTYVLYKIPCPFPYIPNQSILMRVRPH